MEQKFCQSCGMPIDDSTFGKETDGKIIATIAMRTDISRKSVPWTR